MMRLPTATTSTLGFVGTCTVAGLNLASMFAARLVVPLLALSMGASALFVGATAAMFTAVPMLFSLGFGRWLDRVGTLWPMAFAASLAVVAALVFMLIPRAFALLVVAGLVGAGGVFAHMAATQAIGAVEDVTQRARDLGYLVLGYSLFQFSGPLIVGATYQYWGSTAAMLTLGVFSLISLAVLALGGHLFQHKRRQGTASKASRPARMLLAQADLRGWILISSVFVAAQSIYPFVLSLHISQVGLGALEAGWILGAFAVGTFVSRLCTPLLTRRFEIKSTLKGAVVAGALVYGVMPWVRDPLLLAALSWLLALPLGVGVPVALAMIYDAAPSGQVNESVGLSMSLNNLVQTILPLLFGVFASHYGVTPMVLVFALAMLLCGLLGGRR
ncbi:hypothetical protein PspTeo4_15840 [Pseudomonas sp. Teo4]|nr:hypothetical protein [Pseudomonas sp. Teo4]